jgi:phage gp16-like protein
MDVRQADLAKIHIAKKRLSMSDEDYRAMLRTIGGESSSADLSFEGRLKVLAHLGRLGGAARRAPFKKSTDPKERKIWGLWGALGRAGALESRTKSALDSFVKRMTQVDSLEFLNGKQQDMVIEALKAWAERVGCAL